MRARDVMTSPAIAVHTTNSVREAISVLTAHGYTTVPVVDDHGRVVGTFRRPGGRPATGPVTSVMTAPAEVTTPDEDIGMIAERLLDKGLHALPVVVADGVLVGVVARRDLLRTLVRADDMVAANVRGLLDRYAGTRVHWSVDVRDGDVAVGGDFEDDAERRIVTALVQNVRGVVAVTLLGGLLQRTSQQE